MNKNKPSDYSYEDIEVGKIIEFNSKISEDMVNKFADLTGDYNPLHMDEEYAKTTQFKGRIVHGMFAASFFSTLFGMYCPGKKNLYLSQQLNFRKPLRLNKRITIRGEVISKVDSIRLLTIKTMILDEEGNIAIDGEAKVKID